MSLPSDLSAAAAASRARYQSTADPAALSEAIRLGRSALIECAGTGAREGSAALELAVSLSLLFSGTGELRHLDEALTQLAAAERILPPEHPDLSSVYTSTASVRLQRFVVVGRRADLVAAIAAARQGVTAGPADHPSLSSRYANLAGGLRTLYQVAGDPADLDESISQARTGVMRLHPDSSGRSMVFATLAASLMLRFARAQSDADLAEAIIYGRLAVTSAPPGDVHRLTATAVLAGALLLDFELSGRTGSLTEAIGLQRLAVSILPEQDPEYVICLLNLATALRLRFERLGVRPDLDAAIEVVGRTRRFKHSVEHAQCLNLHAELLRERCDQLASAGETDKAALAAAEAVAAAEEAVAAAGSGRARPECLLALANAWATTFRLMRDPSARACAVDAYNMALAEFHDGSPQIPVCQANLGMLHLVGSSNTQAPAELREAITRFRTALATTVPGGPAWAQAIVSLLCSVLLLSEARVTADVEDALTLYGQLTMEPSAPPRMRVVGGILAGTILMTEFAHLRAAEAYADAVEALPAMAWHGIDRTSQEAYLADIAGLAGDAAASQVFLGAAGQAVELLEQGRNVLWAEMLQLRNDDDALSRGDPELALRLRDLAAALNAPDQGAVLLDSL